MSKLKEKLEKSESELKAQQNLGDSMEQKIQQLRAETEAAEKRARMAEDQINSAKMEKLAAESKFLEIEVAHSSCKTHISSLLARVKGAERDLKVKSEAWESERKRLEDDVADRFTTGIDQLRAYLQQKYPSVNIVWSKITLDDVVAVEVGEEKAVGEAQEVGSEKEEAVGRGGEVEGCVVRESTTEVKVEESVTRVRGVVIEELAGVAQ